MSSIFTRIINREIPSEIVKEDDTLIVIKDINPEAKTHLLIIPKTEIATLNDLQSSHKDLLFEMFKTAKEISSELGISDGYKLMFNVGEKYQDVMHIHMHLLSDLK